MLNYLHNKSEKGPERPIHYCAVCGLLVELFKCKCPDGPRIWKINIPKEWQEYFWLDGSIKGDLVYMNPKTD